MQGEKDFDIDSNSILSEIQAVRNRIEQALKKNHPNATLIEKLSRRQIDLYQELREIPHINLGKQPKELTFDDVYGHLNLNPDTTEQLSDVITDVIQDDPDWWKAPHWAKYLPI